MAATDWGVTVEQVSALAPHIAIQPEADGDVGPSTDPLYRNTADRKITRAEVEQFIVSVGARVSGRLYRLGSVPEGDARTAFTDLAADLVANGAAAYLVDAAAPVRASVNADTAYGAVLCRRFTEGLEALAASIDDVLDEPVQPGDGGSPAGAVAIDGNFPPPIFPDGVRW